MREPRVQTGKRTMVYMATSLAFTATGLFVCYLLFRVSPVEGRTLNAVLADATFKGLPLRSSLAFITIFSEGALLLVAAQTGFIDGPRIMANMAVDSWFPHRFSALSERLTTHNGILLMGASSIFILLTTRGSVAEIVVMYSINVFLTFSLSEFGMSRFYIKHRHSEARWLRHLSVHLTGLTLCATILAVTVVEKFMAGGWETLLITAMIVGVCQLIRSHYDKVQKGVSQLDEMLTNLPVFGPVNEAPLNHDDMTAIQLVSGYNGFGVHTLLSILTNFPQTKQIVFASVAVIDSGSFKGVAELKALEESVKNALEEYVNLARKLGFPADYRMTVGIDVVESAEHLCKDIAKEFPRSAVYSGQLTFRLEKFYHRMLHNETAFSIQRRLQWSGITTVILPIRVKV